MEKVAVELANAKLTRSLEILGTRSDGYHLLRSEMLSIDLADRVLFAAGSSLTVNDEISWIAPDGNRPPFDVPAGPDNLVSRALDLVGRHAAVTVGKRIAAGAGLGGGSADAAAVLRHFGFEDLERAAALGADVPFCLSGGRAIVTGIGESVEPLPFEPLGFVVVTPGFSVSTAAVYRAFDDLGRGTHVRNHLTLAALSVEPRLARWRDLLWEWTGNEPVLAGSGSSLFVDYPPAEVARAAEVVRVNVERKGLTAMVTASETVPGVA